MILSIYLEYDGNCKDAISFYSNLFTTYIIQSKLYKEMPLAEVFGITERGLDMMWKAIFEINIGESYIRFEMADSMLVAMGKEINGVSSLKYSPAICVNHINNIDLEPLGIDEKQCKNHTDKYGVNWMISKEENEGIFYCFEYDGFCQDAIDFYEAVFDLKAEDIIQYAHSQYAIDVSETGKGMIYSGVLKFQHGDKTFSLKLRDSLQSAKSGLNSYDVNALLFYKQWYNPVLIIQDENSEFLKKTFDRLLVGGKLNKPIAPDNEGVLNGSLIDRYGICWNFSMT